MNQAPPDLKAAFSEISRISRADGRGRIFAVASGAAQSGTSFVARQLALTAVSTGFQCALIDMGLTENAHYEALSQPHMQAHYGKLAGPYDAGFEVDPFWHVSPMLVDDTGQNQSHASFVGLYMLGQTGLVVTRFLWDKLGNGQNVHIAQARNYWHALRDRYPVSFVDVPSVSQSDAGQTVYGEMDGVILVSTQSNAPENQIVLSQISASNGKCIGAIINRHNCAPKMGDRA